MQELTKADYQNLLAIVSQAHFQGIQGAAVGVALYHKIQTLIQSEDSPSGKSADASAGAQPRAD